MNRCADLHIHTCYSDSTLTPEDVIEQAIENHVDCVAIADHDTAEGVSPTVKAAEKFEVEVLPAIELSSEINGKDVHVLGYLFDYSDKNFLDQLANMQNTRITRMEEMIEKLKSFQIDNITLEEVCELAETKSVGRPHLALKLKEKGWIKSIPEAFDKYIGEGAPAYAPKWKQTPVDAINLIHQAHGVAVLAHPMVTRVDELIPLFVEAGLDGLEVYYPNTAKTIQKSYLDLCRKYDLIATGGSDAHGSAKAHEYVGCMKAPYASVEQLKERQKRYA